MSLSDYTISFLEDENGELPTRIGDFRIKWIATDAWRGYYDTEATKKSKWVKFLSDWVTGNWSDAGEHGSDETEKRVKILASKIEKLGGELRIVFAPTSNVFSTGYDLYVRGISQDEIDGLKE